LKYIFDYLRKIDMSKLRKCTSLKVVLVGNEQVGKTTLARNLKKTFESGSDSANNLDQDENILDSTVGIDIHECTAKNNENTPISLKLWDFAGLPHLMTCT
jgi:GTPase SAR1 family protein